MYDLAIDLKNQIKCLKKYVNFSNSVKIKKMILYAGYYRVSRYSKFLLSKSNIINGKPNQQLLEDLYNLDKQLRLIFLKYCKLIEIQFKTNLSNSISIKSGNCHFYLEESFYNSNQSQSNNAKRKQAKFNFSSFIKKVKDDELSLRRSKHKYPELKEYRVNGKKNVKKIPAWVAFYYFDMGNIVHIYKYLRNDYKKQVIKFGGYCFKPSKTYTNNFDTWLDAVRHIRNTCSHHNILVGKTSSVVAQEIGDNVLINDTDLFSRLYAFKKLLSPKDSEQLKIEMKRLLNKNQVCSGFLDVLPSDWIIRYESIL